MAMEEGGREGGRGRGRGREGGGWGKEREREGGREGGRKRLFPPSLATPLTHVQCLVCVRDEGDKDTEDHVDEERDEGVEIDLYRCIIICIL